VAAQVLKDIQHVLNEMELPALPSDISQQLKGQIEDLSKPSNAVRALAREFYNFYRSFTQIKVMSSSINHTAQLKNFLFLFYFIFFFLYSAIFPTTPTHFFFVTNPYC
jgi:hypothetical protein